MKVTKEGRTIPLMNFTSAYGGVSGGGPSGQVPTSNGSNGVSWGSNIATITVNDVTKVLGPFINFADGSNTNWTVDQNPGSTPSNTLRVHSTGGASVAFGSNSTNVSETTQVGASSNTARADHYHRGIETITASSSNTMQRGTLNLRPGASIALNLTDTDGDGEFDTITIVNTGGGGGGSGGSSLIQRPALTPSSFDSTYGDDFTQTTIDSRWNSFRGITSSQVITRAFDGSWLSVPNLSTGTFSAVFQTAPNTDFDIQGCFKAQIHTDADASAFGIMAVDSSGDGVGVFAGYSDGNLYTFNLVNYTYTSTGQNTGNTTWSRIRQGGPFWLRLVRVGNTWDAYGSHGGDSWEEHMAATISNTKTINRFGFGRIDVSAAKFAGTILCDWFNKA